MRSRLTLCVMLPALAGPVFTSHAEERAVFQGLDEATARIDRLGDKPFDLLIAPDGTFQSETLIFQDARTGHEVWSLTMERATDLANIERRPVWSADGSVFSMRGSRTYRDAAGQLQHTKWQGHNYLMEADLTARRKLYGALDGQTLGFKSKFDTWSNLTPRRLFYVEGDKLFAVDVGRPGAPNPARLLYTFPNDRPKILQNISDNDRLLVQDRNGDAPDDAPLFYVVDTTRDPADPLFVRARSMNLGGVTGVEGHDPRNEFHVHSIGVSRDGNTVTWNYGPADSEGEYVHWSLRVDDFDAVPTPRSAKLDPFGQYMSHPGIGPGERIAYFGGPVRYPDGGKRGGWSLWVRTGAGEPVEIGGPVPGGHATWAGFDPRWFFANASRDWPDKPYAGTIVAGSPDADAGQPVLRIIAHAFDRQRGGKAGFDGIPRPTQSPDATKCWFHSSMLMPDDTTTGSFVVVFRRPLAPTDPRYADGTLQWTPPALAREVKGWCVYRKDGEAWHRLGETSRATTELRVDPGVYMVTAVECSGLESDTSSPVLDTAAAATPAAPVTGFDTTPPPPPGARAGGAGAPRPPPPTAAAPPGPDLRHYHLYSATDAAPQPVQARRFASPPAGAVTHLDWTAPTDGPVHYALTAVDRSGNESAPARVETR